MHGSDRVSTEVAELLQAVAEVAATKQMPSRELAQAIIKHRIAVRILRGYPDEVTRKLGKESEFKYLSDRPPSGRAVVFWGGPEGLIKALRANADPKAGVLSTLDTIGWDRSFIGSEILRSPVKFGRQRGLKWVFAAPGASVVPATWQGLVDLAGQLNPAAHEHLSRFLPVLNNSVGGHRRFYAGLMDQKPRKLSIAGLPKATLAEWRRFAEEMFEARVAFRGDGKTEGGQIAEDVGLNVARAELPSAHVMVDLPHPEIFALLRDPHTSGKRAVQALSELFPRLLAPHFAASAHVDPRYSHRPDVTIGEHAAQWFDHAQAARRSNALLFDAGDAWPAGVDVEAVFLLAGLLHDIGKHQAWLATQRGASVSHHRVSLKIMGPVLRLLGCSTRELKIAEAWVGHDTLGRLASAGISKERAIRRINRRAGGAGMAKSLPQFFRAQLDFNRFDGAAHAWFGANPMVYGWHDDVPLPLNPAWHDLAAAYGVRLRLPVGGESPPDPKRLQEATGLILVQLERQSRAFFQACGLHSPEAVATRLSSVRDPQEKELVEGLLGASLSAHIVVPSHVRLHVAKHGVRNVYETSTSGDLRFAGDPRGYTELRKSQEASRLGMSPDSYGSLPAAALPKTAYLGWVDPSGKYHGASTEPSPEHDVWSVDLDSLPGPAAVCVSDERARRGGSSVYLLPDHARLLVALEGLEAHRNSGSQPRVRREPMEVALFGHVRPQCLLPGAPRPVSQAHNLPVAQKRRLRVPPGSVTH